MRVLAFKRSIYLPSIAGTLCLLISCVFYLLNSWFYNDRDYYYKQIEQNVHRQLTLAESEMEIALQKLSTEPEKQFSALPQDLNHQYYIYRNQSLWYWSDYHYVPSYENLSGNFKYKLLNLQEGQFVVLKSNFSSAEVPQEQYEVFMLLPLVAQTLVKPDGSRHNRDIFISPDFNLSPPALHGVERDTANVGTIYSQDAVPLFDIAIGKSYLKGPNQFKLFSLVFLFIGGGLWVLVLYQFSLLCLRRRKTLQALAILAGGLILIRGLMLFFGFPYALYPFPLFDPQFYASSFINPSLGDFLLNTLAAFMVFLLLLRIWRSKENEMRKWFRARQGNLPWLAGMILSHFILLWVLFVVLHELFLHGQFTLDITSSLEVNGFKLTSWFIFMQLAFIYILFNHILSIGLNELARTFKQALIWHFSAVLLVLLLGIWWPSLLFIGAALGVYFLAFLFIQRKNVIRPYNYQLFVFVFLSATISAVAGALALLEYHKQNRLIVKERFSTQILTDHDLIGEYLLSEVVSEIQDDPYIKSRFLSPLFSKEGVEQKIRRQYLTRYFDRYDTNILLFNVDGSVINHPNRYLNYHLLRERAEQNGYETDYPGLYLLEDLSPGSSARRYQQYIPILQPSGRPLGYVLVDLTLKRYLTHTIYPELFFGQRLQDPQTGRLSYAVFRNGQLEYNAGEFDYVHQFPEELLEDPQLYRQGIEKEGFHHLGVKGQEGQLVIVSDYSDPAYLVFSNFSFLFLLIVLGITCVGVWYVVNYRVSIRKLDFTTKIQLYLNAAVFLPLLVVSVTTLSLINASFIQDTERQYYDKAENISRNLADLLEGRSIMSARESEEISNALAQMARYAEVDIHLFGVKGALAATSQPIIYQQNYLAAHINPLALAEIREQNSRQLLLTETVNNLRYRSAYMAVRSTRDGTLMGILSLPFFESGYELEQQLAAVFSNIVNIFASLFIVFLALLYLLSRELTDPLRYIAAKVKQVSLTGQNEPLQWSANDEIGMLVREYNAMLLNLQASKEALSRSEKESAWREMAKQVAHEIKNPLTPMKLSLQHLSRVLSDKLAGRSEEERVEKTVKSLLDQIDTLSDIATSFSAFAKMPIPKKERFDIAAVLKGVVRLYSNKQQPIEAYIEDGPFWVLGDEQMMQRTFNNLILNGIQSVPENRAVSVVVRLQKMPGNRVLIEIQDNGEGIDENIREKVFVPNFSTKYTGSGLGLAIAKRGIEHAGGRIWFESKAGVGTSFFIELPLMS